MQILSASMAISILCASLGLYLLFKPRLEADLLGVGVAVAIVGVFLQIPVEGVLYGLYIVEPLLATSVMSVSGAFIQEGLKSGAIYRYRGREGAGFSVGMGIGLTQAVLVLIGSILRPEVSQVMPLAYGVIEVVSMVLFHTSLGTLFSVFLSWGKGVHGFLVLIIVHVFFDLLILVGALGLFEALVISLSVALTALTYFVSRHLGEASGEVWAG